MEKRIVKLENRVDRLEGKIDDLEKTAKNTNETTTKIHNALLGTYGKQGFISEHREIFKAYQAKKTSSIWWDRLVVSSIGSIIVGGFILLITNLL